MNIERLSPHMKRALPIIRETFHRYSVKGIELEFTAGQEWFHHGKWSLHHSGNALDIRTRTQPDRGVGIISPLLGYYLQQALDNQLGKGKYLVLVNDQGPHFPHIHVQYNPGARASEPGDYPGSTKPVA
jgi:hypothetical protein